MLVVRGSGPMLASAPTPRGGTRDGTPGRRALRVVAESRRDCPGQRHRAERLRCGWEGREEIGAEITPKVSSNAGQSLSHGCAVPASFAQGSLALRGTGDADRRVAALLTMTTDFCHSEASAHTGRGNPSFLRWTGVRAAVPRAWPPPAKFRPQHRAAASSAPTKRRDSCRNHPSQRRTAERLRRGREGWAGIGAKTIPKGGPPRDRLGSA